MKILIVDDEPLVRKSLARACQARGHQVAEAPDGRLGLDLWRQFDPDLAFVDVLMPGLSGPDLIRELGQPRRARVILMSAYSGEHNIETAQQVGADLFISKPFENIFLVVETAEELLGEKRPG